MRFERREHRPLYMMVLAPLLAIVVALALAGILIAIAGAPVLEAYWRILMGAFGSRLSATETLTRATPLILTGLAAAVAFRARLWNIGAEGQFYFGAIAVAAFGSKLLASLPAPILIPLLLVIGAIAGMVLILIPLWLRLRFSVDEVVTSLILNFIAVLFVSMLIDGSKAAVQWRAKIRSAVTGETVETDLFDLIELEGGRIKSFFEFCDTALAARMMKQ